MGTDCWVTELNVCRILKVLDLEGRTWKEWIMNCFFFSKFFGFLVMRFVELCCLPEIRIPRLTFASSYDPLLHLKYTFPHTRSFSHSYYVPWQFFFLAHWRSFVFLFFFVQSSKNPKITIIINNEIAICDTRETVDKASPENELSGDARVSRVSSLLTPERKWKKCHRVTYKIRYVAHCHPKYSVWIS